MALTFRLIVRVAALRAGFPLFTSYTLLGDDLVIASAAVAEQYRILCTQHDMAPPIQIACVQRHI